MTAAWRHSRWERDTRYYELRLQQDLWGDWVLQRVWGRKDTALGQIRQDICASHAAGEALFDAARTVRAKRRYREIVLTGEA